VVILDNRIVAMTGHQPTPESGRTAMGDEAKIVKVQEIAKSLGIDKVETVDPYDLKKTLQVIKSVMEYEGPSVIVSERPCPLRTEKGPTRQVQETCNLCGVCVKSFGCPAISLGKEHAEIDETLCQGCGVCEQVCPFDAIRSKTP
jgi:indolepyruvate ferredoxin oxidoreductase alpha subunit